MHVPRFSGESAFTLRDTLREAREGFYTVTFGRDFAGQGVERGFADLRARVGISSRGLGDQSPPRLDLCSLQSRRAELSVSTRCPRSINREDVEQLL